MESPKRLEKSGLLERLDMYKLIIQVNSDLLEEDRLLGERILQKLGMIDSQVNEMNEWERVSDQPKYDYSLYEVNRTLAALKELIQQILGDDDGPIDYNLGNLS
jgi:hypothetical protein